MANTILHETAHQKQHVKKGEDEMVDSDGDGTLDAPMEMGERLSIDIFGGHIGYFPDRGVLMSRDTDGDGRPDTEDEAVDDATIRNWLDCDRWRRGVNSLGSTRVASQAGDSGLEITISTIKQEFSDEEPIIVDVTLSNGGTSPIKVLPGIFGIHYPLAFVIENEQGEFAEWQGPIRHMSFSDDAYRTLNPGESLNISYDLRYDENAEKWRYDLFTWGTYTITAFYSQFVLPFDSVKSNEITITVKNSPHVRVTANPRWGSPPLTVTLDASESYDPDGTIVRHEWDFEGDGVLTLTLAQA